MRKFKLSNGLKVLLEKRKSSSLAIEVCIRTGSNNEPASIAGISHFLEHMMFEGTATRTSKQISESIENVGGELNAATSNERTYYYVKIPKKKAELGFEILSDMLKNPAFGKKELEKERKVILEEIKMVHDQPLFYQWVLFGESLFKSHPARNPVYGRFDSVKAITRKNLVSYYMKWYVPNNMILSIVGDVKDPAGLAKKYFGDLDSRPLPVIRKSVEPEDVRPTLRKKKRDTKQAYLVLGYKTVPRLHRDSFVLDVISAIFHKGLSGRISEEIRVKRGLAYSVGADHESKKDFGFFAFHLNCDLRNLETCRKIILNEVDKLCDIDLKEIEDAKEHIIGSVLLSREDSQKSADDLAFWEFIRDARLAKEYLNKIKNVKRADIIRAKKRYFGNNFTQVVISK